MNRLLSAACLLLPLLSVSTRLNAEKKPLDHSVYDTWQKSEINKLSKDASILVYTISEQDGDAELHIRRTSTGEELVVPRGTDFKMTEDSKVATLKIKSFRKDQKAKENFSQFQSSILKLVCFRFRKMEV